MARPDTLSPSTNAPASDAAGPAGRPIVHSMYWDNVPEPILRKQREVFEHLGLPLHQENANKTKHGDWMNALVARHAPADVVVICDIDAFPLSVAAYERAIDCAQQGGLFGLAQFSNHKPGDDVYAGPMFMALTRQTWQRLGAPDLRSSKLHDAAEVLTPRARQAGVPVDLCYPSSTLISKWALGHEGVFGIGTFYGRLEFFHLFESRKPGYEAILTAVADDVVAARPLDFNRYLALAEPLQQVAATKPKRSWWKKLAGK